MPNAIDVDGRRGLTQLPRVSLSTLGRLATELPAGLRLAVTLQLEAFAPLQGPPLRGEQFTFSYGMQEMSLCMSIAALMLLKSAAHLSVVDKRTALATAPARGTARAELAGKVIQDAKMSLAQFDGDFAFCEPVTAHKATFVEVQAGGLTPADLPAVGEYLTPEATFNVFPKEVGVFLSPTIAAAMVLLPPTAQATVQFLPLWLALGSRNFIRPHQATIETLGAVPKYRTIRQAAIDAATDVWSTDKTDFQSACNRAMQLCVAAMAVYAALLETCPLQVPAETLHPMWVPDHAKFREWLLDVSKERSNIGQSFSATSVTGGTQSERSKSANGVKYLTSQLSRNDSAFHMPAQQAEQQAWEEWFLKLAEVPDYYEMSSEQIIYAVTGHMKYNDRLLYGWPDTVSRLRTLGKPVTLDAFFAHIRTTLLACRKTRKSAYDELMSLSSTLSSIADCAALCVRLRQVWTRLCPVATSEREPITRQAAILHIHKTLSDAREGGYKLRQHSMLLTAWHRCHFDSAVLYEAFVADVHHTTVLDSVKNSELYLQALFKDLTRAHTLYVNLVHDEPPATHSALAIQPTKSVQTSGKDGKRGRSASRDSTADRGNGNSRASSAGQQPTAAKAVFKGLTEEGEKRERNHPAGCKFTDVAAAAGLNLFMDVCCARGRQSQCFMCSEPGGHKGGPLSCPKVTPQHHAAVKKVVAARAANRKAQQGEYNAGVKARKVAAAK